MAEELEEDTPMPDKVVPEAGSPSGSGSDSEGEGEEEKQDWLATSREKRSTAGNRLSSLLQQEEPDDELELLFAEADDDAAFEDSEDGSDAQMDSSDDDEDGAPAAGDDLEGEAELQRQAKAERLAKKRKRDEGVHKVIKRVKIDPTAIQEPKPRPKKKSERLSWLPTAEEAPTRSSQRGTTKQQKQALYAQMVEREVKRLEQMKKMEKVAAAKAAMKKPPMTQAERMAEAAKVERKNAKSLNRWEQAEREREAERRAKLDALHTRQLEGPVITWWSGMAEWVGGNLKKVGKILTLEDPKEKPRKRKATEMEADGEATPVPENVTANAASSSTTPAASTPPVIHSLPQVNSGSVVPESTGVNPPTEANGIPPSNVPPITPTTQPPSFQSRASPIVLTPPPYVAPLPNPPRATGPLQPPAHLAHLLPGQSPYHYVPLPSISNPAPASALMPPPPIPQSTFTSSNSLMTPPPPPPPPTPPPPVIEHATRNYLIFQNFDETAIKSKDVQTQVLMNRTFHKNTSTSFPLSFHPSPISPLPFPPSPPHPIPLHPSPSKSKNKPLKLTAPRT